MHADADLTPRLIKVGRHAALMQLLAAWLTPTAIRHSRLAYELLFAREPDPEVTRSWIEPTLSNEGIRRDAAKLMSAMRPEVRGGRTFISMEFPELVADAISEAHEHAAR